MMHLRTRRGLALAGGALALLAILAVLAGPAAADERFVGTWKAEGTDEELGAYTGTVHVTLDDAGRLNVRGAYRFAEGKQEFSAPARVDGDRLAFAWESRGSVTGIAGALLGEEDRAESTRYTASYRVGDEPSTLDGTWRVSRSVRRRDVWSRGVMAITSVRPDEVALGETHEVIVRGELLPAPEGGPRVELRRSGRRDTNLAVEHVSTNAAGTRMTLSVAVDRRAVLGPRDLRVDDETVTDAVSVVAPESSDDEPPNLRLVPAFPRLRFFRPVYFTAWPGGGDEVVVVEQQGMIYRFPNRPDVTRSDLSVVLDLRRKVTMRGNEQGLLGLAFDGDTAYVHYSERRSDGDGVISRFAIDGGEIDRFSEQVLLRVSQPYENHNGGMLAIGPDGNLYIGLGDGGAADDPFRNGQNTFTHLGTILRIDPNGRGRSGRPYGIPSGNPFASGQRGAPEVFAWGMRNPWRFSFDRSTGELWVGDVGQERYEEVDVVPGSGGNFGWRRWEGFSSFDRSSPGDDAIDPVLHYPAEEGKSIIGGYVYRGPTIGWLQGRYVFADYVTGNVWSAKRGGERSLPSRRWRSQDGVAVHLITASRLNISSFGEDASGELFACAFDGRIYRFEGGAPPAAAHAAFIADTDIFDELEGGASGLDANDRSIPYTVNAALWSDGISKDRHIDLPAGGQLLPRDGLGWDAPPGARFVKTFHYERVRGDPSTKTLLETRVIQREEGGGWSALTYIWNEAGTDARAAQRSSTRTLTIQEPDGSVTRQRWYFPSQSDCFKCHTQAAGVLLGITTAQLNTGGQIEALADRGHIDADELPARLPTRMRSGSVAGRARAYLDANCSFCHRPGAPGNARIDLRHDIPLSAARMIDEPPAQSSMGLGRGARIIRPGEPERSTLFERMRHRGRTGVMPPLATAEVDEAALEMLEQWIREMGQ